MVRHAPGGTPSAESPQMIEAAVDAWHFVRHFTLFDPAFGP
jgi:hypothetical protein